MRNGPKFYFHDEALHQIIQIWHGVIYMPCAVPRLRGCPLSVPTILPSGEGIEVTLWRGVVIDGTKPKVCMGCVRHCATKRVSDPDGIFPAIVGLPREICIFSKNFELIVESTVDFVKPSSKSSPSLKLCKLHNPTNYPSHKWKGPFQNFC